MQNWKYYKDEHIEFYTSERAINSLVEALYDFENKWLDYLKSEYKDYQKEKLNYVDISFIGRYVIELLKENKNNELDVFFETVERIYENCDSETAELLTIGLLESIQNNSPDAKIDYHYDFNNWLKPKTRKEWNNLIDFWGKEREKKNS